ncbi:DUF996 domain-containing protein [Vulcanisaeta distributa]|uniref:DUF996 domain-containing protein n=1 Tax=Vulcanisaeta distributa (strain DSM 14429 / JCM 11212 / NBRC 100878 / IC-017) TaxID=572478 RepID=E1QQE4_VULDI|nr:DUF996 domain-containing protein [Vulcanisaeta distributa]ADN50439.1 protein of unknown function DUF996 [Vulcanisaeta distributa DSM 14429]
MDLNNAKVVAGIGAVLAGVGFLGYGALGIAGIVMFLVGIIEIAGNLRDNALRSDAIAWFILTIVAFAVFIVGLFLLFFIHNPAFSMVVMMIAHAIGIPGVHYGPSGIVGYTYTQFTELLQLMELVMIVGAFASIPLIISAAFMYRIARRTYAYTGSDYVRIGGLLYIVGAVLMPVFIGLILLLIAWLMIGIALLTTEIKRP